MKTSFFSFFLLLASSWSAMAQQVDNYHQDSTTIYQRTNGYYLDPVRSKWRKEIKQENENWTVSLYDKSDNLQETIPYSDKDLTERKGLYRSYADGKVTREGNYDKGYRIGEWKRYYPGGQLKENAMYDWGKLDGKMTRYWENGKEKSVGRYAENKKTGMWRLYYPTGKIALQEVYINDGSLLSGTYFDEKGGAITKDKLVTTPSYPGGEQALRRFLYRQVEDKSTLENCKIKFWVSAEGWLYNIEIETKLSDVQRRTLARAFRQSGKWTPGTELGENVDMPQEITLSR